MHAREKENDSKCDNLKYLQWNGKNVELSNNNKTSNGIE